MQLIKQRLKQYTILRKILDIKNSVLIKTGLRFHIYDTIADRETRDFLKHFLPSKLSAFKDNNVLKVLMIGSPGLQEIKDIPLEVLTKLDITCVDKSDPITLNVPLYNQKFFQMNIFDFFNTKEGNEKYDIILSRWFFHHISEKNKERICSKCHSLLKAKGFFILIDWFIDDWETQEDLFNAVRKFHEYRTKYYPLTRTKLTTKGRDKSEYWWDIIHKDEDWSGGKHPSRNKIKKYLHRAGFCNIELYEVANKKIIDDPYLWGNLLVYSENNCTSDGTGNQYESNNY